MLTDYISRNDRNEMLSHWQTCAENVRWKLRRYCREPKLCPVLAFLKRRWILLSCGAVLVACAFFDLEILHLCYVEGDRTKVYEFRTVGLYHGDFSFRELYGADFSNWAYWDVFVAAHSPQIGTRPECDHQDLLVFLSIPLWLPLSVILGWLVIRELRWRETARAPALPSNAGGEARRSRGIRGDNRARKAGQP